MSDLHASYGAPHVSKEGFISPDHVMHNLISRTPSLANDQKEAVNSLIKEALGDLGEYIPSELLMAMLTSEGTRSFWRVTTKLSDTTADDTEEKVKRRKANAKEIVVLGLVRVARKMTGAQCAKAGSNFIKLSKMVRPKQIVGEVLTDEEIAEVLRGSE